MSWNHRDVVDITKQAARTMMTITSTVELHANRTATNHRPTIVGEERSDHGLASHPTSTDMLALDEMFDIPMESEF